MHYLSNIKQSHSKNKDKSKGKQNGESDMKIESEINDESGNTKVKAEEVLKICSNVYGDNALYKILFKDLDRISNKEEYLEMILLILPDKDIQQIIKVVSHYSEETNKSQIIDFFWKIIRRIDLNKEIGFLYLKEVIILFIDGKNNFMDSYVDIEKKFVINNSQLRCSTCFKLPLFSVNSQNEISLLYKCGHLEKIESNKLQELCNAKFKCSCNKLVLKSNLNYICSSCKNIICPVCLNEHFEKCLFIFFVELSKIDNTCLEHNEKYEAYCETCELGLCEKCCKEHHHYVEKGKNDIINSKDLENFKTKLQEIAKSNKIEKHIISAIDCVIQENIYKSNLQFIHFMRKILGDNSSNNNEFFEEFFDEKFQNYYKFMIYQIKNKNYYYLKKLKDMREYYENKKVNEKYQLFLLENFFNYSNYQDKIINNNIMKFSILSKYYQTISEIRTQKQIYDDELKIQTALINNEENNILIKCLSSSESLYEIELLKLIDRSMAENLIVYLIENYPNHFKKLELNLSIYADLKKYYKNDKGKFEEFTSKNLNKIKKFLPLNTSNSNNNVENNEIDNKIIFEKEIKSGKENLVNVKDLNQMLQFLFFVKEQGNFTAHPSNDKNVILNPNKQKINLKNNDDINLVAKKIEKKLKNEYVKKNFEIPVNPKVIFECLFENKFKSLISARNNKELDQKINILLNKSLEGIEEQKNEHLLTNYIQGIEKLEEIRKTLGNIDNCKNGAKTEISNSLNEFFKRINKILNKNSEEKNLAFLYRLNNNEIESSLTGEKNSFLSCCLDYLLKDISKKINDKISDFQKSKSDIETLMRKKEQTLYFLKNVIKYLSDMDDVNEPIVDTKKFKEYLRRDMNNSESEEIDMNKIRSNLGKIVNRKLDWTRSNKCNLSTLLYLNQNKN